MVEGGGVGEGGVLAHGGVQVLLVPVGAEGRCVERDQRRAAGLGPGQALDRGVDRFRGPLPAGDQADHLRPALAGAVMVLPGPADEGVVMEKGPVIPEDQVSAGDQVLPVLLQGGVPRRGGGVPAVEEGQERPGRRAVCPVQEPVVERPAGPEALHAPLGLALGVRAQEIAGIVPKEIGEDAHRALDRGREGDAPGEERGLLAPRLLRLERDHPLQSPAAVDAQGEGDLRVRPAGPRDLPLGGQGLIVLAQCLQDRPIASPLSRAGTRKIPSVSLARKNRGTMFDGSE